MSIYIKEYLSFVLIIGVIKLIVPDNKIEFVIKLACFAAMITIIVLPLINYLSYNKVYDFAKKHTFSETANSQQTINFSDYFTKSVADNYSKNVCTQIKQAFIDELKSKSINVYSCEVTYDSNNYSLNATTNECPNTAFINSFKSNYSVNNISIRLVNTYD